MVAGRHLGNAVVAGAVGDRAVHAIDRNRHPGQTPTAGIRHPPRNRIPSLYSAQDAAVDEREPEVGGTAAGHAGGSGDVADLGDAAPGRAVKVVQAAVADCGVGGVPIAQEPRDIDIVRRRTPNIGGAAIFVAVAIAKNVAGLAAERLAGLVELPDADAVAPVVVAGHVQMQRAVLCPHAPHGKGVAEVELVGMVLPGVAVPPAPAPAAGIVALVGRKDGEGAPAPGIERGVGAPASIGQAQKDVA